MYSKLVQQTTQYFSQAKHLWTAAMKVLSYRKS